MAKHFPLISYKALLFIWFYVKIFLLFDILASRFEIQDSVGVFRNDADLFSTF